jgi:CubicO group peptidase (beta-lactamase class C family)
MEAFLERTMQALRIPGLSIAVIERGEVAYHRNLGVENLETQEPVTATTLVDAGSMSKSGFAYFVMTLVDGNHLGLDTLSSSGRSRPEPVIHRPHSDSLK